MQPWAIEEIWLRPAATLIACALVPLATLRILSAVLGGRGAREGAFVLTAVEALLAFVAGAGALGPALVEAPWGIAAVAFGALCAGVVLVVKIPRARRLEAEPRRRGAAIAAGLTIGLTLAAAGLAARAVSAIEEDQAPVAGDAAARWRLRVEPWDPVAMIAAGWAAREGSAERALAWAEEARRLGGPEPSVLELEAEVLAARGECERARAAFDRALAARAEAAFRDPLGERLELGGYRLPPSLLAECGEGVGE